MFRPKAVCRRIERYAGPGMAAREPYAIRGKSHSLRACRSRGIESLGDLPRPDRLGLVMK